ncbi:hypothetical protein ILUMI_06957, partial [Ignelater luminosus]
SISPFDGNRDELASFLANCDAAFEIAHDTQLIILLRFVVTQIQGKAKAAICNRDFKDWRELLDFLKLLYQDRKHYAQLPCELTNIQQKQNENIHQFIERVETLLKRVTTAIKQNTKNQQVTVDRDNHLLQGKLDLMQDIALQRFIHFTHPKISDRLRSCKLDSLNEAMTIAISEEISLKMINPSKQNQQHRPSHHSPKPNYFNANNQPKFDSPQEKFQQNSNWRVNEVVQSSNTKSCAYCKNLGHTIQECRKRKYKESIRNSQNNSNVHHLNMTHSSA